MDVSPGWPVYLCLAVLLVVTLLANRLSGVGLGRQSAIAGARAVVQLSLVALVITAVVGSLGLSFLAVGAMFATAVATTSKRVGAPRTWPWAAAAMACGVVPVVAIVLATGAVPLTGIAVIPVAGIVIGNTMTVHTLVGRRTFAALREEHGQYEASLSLGLTSSQAIDEIIARRVPEGILPSLDQVRTSGIVTLPGAFIGVMLGGGSAVQAATAQVLVLFAIMATQSITAGVQAALIRRRLLLPADLGVALVS
ncbi:ABC transporter permease [Terrabacter sp. Root85]|uniref:ABC transporter permease n=1 Tax=unclassified Terrabacter TaxID=2630222 RepID=UPI0006FA9D46|nr:MULTISPECIES: ABC transporter permease [unclassified Terrabacter]KRC89487.1 ABC transporter permease [Terrabacter sp. Root85]KRF48256.1 ABC transporter permease [Terrabacter sp. Soil811]